MHYYKEKQVFSWRTKKFKLGALLREKAGFLMTQLKIKCKYDALLRGKEGFWMTHKKNLIFDALLRGKACFLMTRPKGAKLLHY